MQVDAYGSNLLCHASALPGNYRISYHNFLLNELHAIMKHCGILGDTETLNIFAPYLNMSHQRARGESRMQGYVPDAMFIENGRRVFAELKTIFVSTYGGQLRSPYQVLHQQSEDPSQITYDLPTTRRARRITNDIITKLRVAEGSAAGMNGPAVQFLMSTPGVKKLVVDGSYGGVSSDIISLIIRGAKTKASMDFPSSGAATEDDLAACYQSQLFLRLWESMAIGSMTYASQCRSIISPLFAHSAAASKHRVRYHANIRRAHRSTYYAAQTRITLPLLEPWPTGLEYADAPPRWSTM